MTSVAQIYDKDQQLEKALEAVANIEPDFHSALLDAADIDAEYEIEFAKHYLKGEGSIEARKADATVKTAELLKARNNRRAVKEFLRTKLKDAQDAVSARQSLLRADLRTNERFSG